MLGHDIHRLDARLLHGGPVDPSADALIEEVLRLGLRLRLGAEVDQLRQRRRLEQQRRLGRVQVGVSVGGDADQAVEVVGDGGEAELLRRLQPGRVRLDEVAEVGAAKDGHVQGSAVGDAAELGEVAKEA